MKASQIAGHDHRLRENETEAHEHALKVDSTEPVAGQNGVYTLTLTNKGVGKSATVRVVSQKMFNLLFDES